MQRQAGGDEDRLVAGAADLKEDLALVLELDFLVVELARQEHAAIDVEQLRRGDRDPSNARWPGVRTAVVTVDDGGLHPARIIASGLGWYMLDRP